MVDPLNEIDTLCIFAARYAHNRNTGAALATVRSLIAQWDKLKPTTKEQIIKESHEATTCIEDWVLLRKLVNDEDKTV
ncbi:hypothetical protein A3715_18545 [Oleiphilus sp. HI0009]|nr:hypothetical protein A3715_18545 [Oleiphilus sp. HI0009]